MSELLVDKMGKIVNEERVQLAHVDTPTLYTCKRSD